MSVVYIILKDVTAYNVNAEQGAYIGGVPSPLSFLNYADAIAFNAKSKGVEMQTKWVLPIYHQMDGRSINKGIMKKDISFSAQPTKEKLVNPSFRDEKTMTLRFSLVAAFDYDPDDYAFSKKFMKIRMSIPNRILGGKTFVDFMNEEVAYVGEDSGWKDNIPIEILSDSHIMKHRLDITKSAKTLEQLIEMTSLTNRNLSPISIGFEILSDEAVRKGQRSDLCNHVFVDPLISAVEWLYATRIKDENVHVWVKKTTENLLITDSKQEQYQ